MTIKQNNNQLNKLFFTLVGFVLSISLVACGQKSALYLPKDSQKNLPKKQASIPNTQESTTNQPDDAKAILNTTGSNKNNK